MKPYKLTFKDKLYFCLIGNYDKRYSYLFSKVWKHQLEWFIEKEIELSFDFDRYIKNYVEALIFEYECSFD